MSLQPLLLTISLGLLAACALQRPSGSAETWAGASSFTGGEHVSDSGALSYKLYRPASAAPREAGHPLLVMLHGCTQDADDFAAGTRMNSLAEQHGFMVLYPVQPSSAHPQKCWNWYEPAHQTRGAGEPGAIAALVQHLIESEPIDTDRVYVAGVSAGGAMSLILASHYPELFAATGVHSAIAPGAASGVQEALLAMRDGPLEGRADAGVVRAAMGDRARLVPLIMFHGAADPVVAAGNAERLESQWATVSAAVAGGAGELTRTTTRPVGASPAYTRRVTQIGGRTVVESWLVDELGHAWSGGSEQGTYAEPAGPDASAAMMRFFIATSRTGS